MIMTSQPKFCHVLFPKLCRPLSSCDLVLWLKFVQRYSNSWHSACFGQSGPHIAGKKQDQKFVMLRNDLKVSTISLTQKVSLFPVVQDLSHSFKWTPLIIPVFLCNSNLDFETLILLFKLRPKYSATTWPKLILVTTGGEVPIQAILSQIYALFVVLFKA